MVVFAGAVVDLTAGMAAFDLNRGVTDGEAIAQTSFEVPHQVLCVAKGAIADDDMTAQGRLIG